MRTPFFLACSSTANLAALSTSGSVTAPARKPPTRGADASAWLDAAVESATASPPAKVTARAVTKDFMDSWETGASGVASAYFASFFSAAALSVVSHVRSLSSLPK